MPRRFALTLALVAAAPAAFAQGVELAPHRAIYDLELVSAEGSRAVDSARGRIAYEITGGRCEGYAVTFRQVLQMTSGETGQRTTDLRATNFEAPESKSFRFMLDRDSNGVPGGKVEGTAEQDDAGLLVKLKQPQPKETRYGKDIVFPSAHTRRLIETALAGKTVIELPFYDGSDNGEKVYDTTTIIGRPLDQSTADRLEETARKAGIDKLRRWPMTISYFPQSAGTADRAPIYTLTLELFENGVSRALVLDYGNLKLKGVLKQIDMSAPAKC